MNVDKTFFEKNRLVIYLIGFLVLCIGFWMLKAERQLSEYEKAVTRQKHNDQAALQRLDNSGATSGGYQTPSYVYLCAIALLGILSYLIYKSPTLATIVFVSSFGLLMISIFFDNPRSSPTSREGNLFLGMSRILGIVGMIGGGIACYREQKKNSAPANISAGENDFNRTPLTNLNRCAKCNLINASGKTVCFNCGTSL